MSVFLRYALESNQPTRGNDEPPRRAKEQPPPRMAMGGQAKNGGRRKQQELFEMLAQSCSLHYAVALGPELQVSCRLRL